MRHLPQEIGVEIHVSKTSLVLLVVGAQIEGDTPLFMHPLLQIHDELVFECPDEHAERAKQIIVHEMEHAIELCVPLQVDAAAAKNWFDGK